MGKTAYNRKKGQRIRSDATLVPLERVFIGRYNLSEAQAAAADTDGILVNTELTTARTLTTGFNNPPAPRALTYDCSASGVTGNVVVVGTNIKDEAITETKALNGTTVVPGVIAFKSITSIALPAKVHTKAKQSFSKTVTNACTTKNGAVTLTITSALYTPARVITLAATTTAHDDVTKTAAALVALINADAVTGLHFLASNVAGKITVTALVEAANDVTLAAVYADNADPTGVAMGADADPVAGVPPDLVIIGYGDIIGLPVMTKYKKVRGARLDGVLEATAPTEVADADEIEKNTLVLNSSLNGKEVDILMYLDNE